MTRELSDARFVGEFLTRLEGTPLDPFSSEKDVHHWVARVAETCIGDAADDLRVLCEGRDLAEGLIRLADTRLLGGSFWPDVVVVRGDARSPVIAVEAKLLKAPDGPGGISSSIGQALAYRYGKPSLPEGRGYPVAVAVVVDERTKGIIDVSSEDPQRDAAEPWRTRRGATEMSCTVAGRITSGWSGPAAPAAQPDR